MAPKPEVSIGMGLATGVLVIAIFQGATPSVADGRTAKPGDDDYSASTKLASWTAAGAVAGISLIAKDPTVFILGGAITIAMSWWHKHANLVDPAVKRASAAMNMDKVTTITQAMDPDAYGYADNVA